MKLTTRGHYSVKALLDLVLHDTGAPISQRSISERQQIPQPYLEQLLIKLRKAGLIQVVRGPKGGYRLSRAPRDITLGAILRAVGETGLPLNRWATDSGESADWVTLALWRRIQLRWAEVLEHITLEDLYYDARSYQAAQGKDTDFIV
ncbi:RrF2 family transcriptional regulator [Anthocerotibacter panamensis]|uniref:RrF2 family transcriptional regulator n=1 Tax=Anthocerotibacter panamensis TaxID=2857077 RepID=UPI001C406811|nr:Rrf2 family transcriptional regulator [Anthocerotibacter panamensis]